MMSNSVPDTRLELARLRDNARRVRDTERRNARRDKQELTKRFTKKGN